MKVDWQALLSQTGYPVAYNHFPVAEGSYRPPMPPFICWLTPQEQHRGADGLNMLSTDSVRVELYTEIKDTAAEAKVESVLTTWPYSKDETWISEQKMYLISYDLTYLRRT